MLHHNPSDPAIINARSSKQSLFLEPGDTCCFATMNPDFSATYPLDADIAARDAIRELSQSLRDGRIQGRMADEGRFDSLKKA